MINDNKVSIAIPATTANLGPGFDCIGMAIDIWNSIEIEPSKSPGVEVNGEGAEELPTGTTNLIYSSATALFNHVGMNPPKLLIKCQNNIPLERGLGSSAAAIVGGLLAANYLSGEQLSESEILTLARNIEGHSDNVTPALLGGTQIIVSDDPEFITAPIEIAIPLKLVIFIPEFKINTQSSRNVLPDKVSHADAIYNVSRVALLINALTGNRPHDLPISTRDRLHQPYRGKLFPSMDLLLDAAIDANALGSFLSGSGPSVIAFTDGHAMTIAYEMAEIARKANIPGEIIISKPTTEKAHLINSIK